MTNGAEGTLPSRWKWIDWLLLTLAVALALWVRLTHIDPVLSFDEIWHLETTLGFGSIHSSYVWNEIHSDVQSMTSLDHAAPVWAIWHDMRGVLHPPLFLIALRLWREICGDGDFAAHLFSITWSLIAIGFTFASARLSMNRWAALFSGTALACAQTQVYFAQEVRAYAMLIGLGSIALWMMTRCEVLGVTKRRLVLLGLMTPLLILTHYFALGASAAIVAYGLYRSGPHRRMFVGVIAACVVFYVAAWVPFAVRQVKDFQTGDVLLKIAHRDVMFTTLLLIGSPFRLLAERDYMVEFTPVYSGVLFVLPWFLFRRLRPLLPWVLWLTLSMGAIWMLDMARTTRHAAYIRYLAIATPAVPLLFIGVAWPLRKWLSYGIGIVITFVGLIYLISKNGVTYDAQPYPLAAAALAKHIQPGEPVLSFEWREDTLWRAEVLIMVASHEPDVFPRSIAILSRPMTPAMVRQLPSKSAWLFAHYDIDPQNVVPGAKVIGSFLVDEDLRLNHIEIDSPEPTTRDADGSIGEAVPSK